MYIIVRVSSGEQELMLHLCNIAGSNIEAIIGAGADAMATIARGILGVPGNAHVDIAVQAGSPAPPMEGEQQEGAEEEPEDASEDSMTDGRTDTQTHDDS